MQRKKIGRVILYGTLGVVVLLILAHPYSRQSLFGPTIDGLPFCYWQEQVRIKADPQGYERSLASRLAALVGLRRQPMGHHMPNDPDAVFAVMLSLVDDPSPRVRKQAGYYVAVMHERDGARAALLRLLDDPDPQVRTAAADALRPHARPIEWALPRLTALLDDPDPRCRVYAACALWHMGKDRSPRVRQALSDALQDPAQPLRWIVVLTVCVNGKDTPEVLPELIQSVKADPSNNIRRLAAGELHTFGTPAVPFLIELLREPDAEVRVGASHSLGMIGRDAHEAVPALTPLLNDPDENVRFQAANTLAKIDPKQQRP